MFKQTLKHLGDAARFKVTFFNEEADPTRLNEGCGAEFVQKEVRFPSGLDHQDFETQKCASFDGDADRLIYFFRESGKLVLIDGDK